MVRPVFMISRPTLSICIPAYNRPKWLIRALVSAIAGGSGYQDRVEIIVSDDSTIAECGEVARSLLAGWEGTKQYRANQPSLGMAENWNQAIRMAGGEYVLMLHDDDFILQGGVEAILRDLEGEPKFSVFLFGVKVVDERERVLRQQGVRRSRYLPPREALKALLSNSSFVRFPAIAIKREVFESVGYFDPRWGEPADIEMWVRLFSQYGVYCVAQTTCAYTVHLQALTMGMFSEAMVRRLLEIFERVSLILNEEELQGYREMFFHQFILAGAFRMARRGKWQEFRRVMELFDLKELQGLKCPGKWLVVQWGFKALARL